jgi:hypothetical protein
MTRISVLAFWLLLAACGPLSTEAPSPMDTLHPDTETAKLGPTFTLVPSLMPTDTVTPVPTPLPVAKSSYESSRTSMCVSLNGLSAVGYADFNRDGREDVLTGYGSGTTDTTPLEMLIQKPSGVLVPDNSLLPSPIPGSVSARKVIVVDFNGDKDPDAFVADHGFDKPPFPGAQPILLLSQDGKLEVGQIPNLPTGFQHSASAADINGDGAPDIFVTDTDNGAYLLMNDGAGGFTVTRQGIPAVQEGYYTSELIDLDDDGFYELLVGGHEHEGAATHVFWGDATGTFTRSRSTQVPNDMDYGIVLDFDAEDLDGDGVRELLLTRTKPSYQGYYFQMLRVADRDFVDVSDRIVPSRSTWEGSSARWIPWIILRDFNGDGSLDLVVPDNDCNPVYLNDGQGNFTSKR